MGTCHRLKHCDVLQKVTAEGSRQWIREHKNSARLFGSATGSRCSEVKKLEVPKLSAAFFSTCRYVKWKRNSDYNGEENHVNCYFWSGFYDCLLCLRTSCISLRKQTVKSCSIRNLGQLAQNNTVQKRKYEIRVFSLPCLPCSDHIMLVQVTAEFRLGVSLMFMWPSGRIFWSRKRAPFSCKEHIATL